MRSITRGLLAATVIALPAGAFAAETDAHRSPVTLRAPVQIIVGAGEGRERLYVESGSSLAPVTAFAGAPVAYSPGVTVLQGVGESAQHVIVPLSQAPRTRYGAAPVQARRG